MSTSVLNVKRDNEFDYDILFRHDFSDLSETMKKLAFSGRKACIVTETNVAPLYAEAVKAELEKVCAHVSTFVFQAGEEQKNLDTVNQIYE